MKRRKVDIRATRTLRDVLNHVKTIADKTDIFVFLDFDDTLIDVNTDQLFEPEVAKELISYLIKEGIHFSVITGRFYETVCDPRKREIKSMEYNVVKTMHPILEELGLDVRGHQTPIMRSEYYEVKDHNDFCVGIVYMGIMFTPHKGPMIKHWMRQTGLHKGALVFADDYDEYISSVANTLPHATIFKRYPPLK